MPVCIVLCKNTCYVNKYMCLKEICNKTLNYYISLKEKYKYVIF